MTFNAQIKKPPPSAEGTTPKPGVANAKENGAAGQSGHKVNGSNNADMKAPGQIKRWAIQGLSNDTRFPQWPPFVSLNILRHFMWPTKAAIANGQG